MDHTLSRRLQELEKDMNDDASSRWVHDVEDVKVRATPRLFLFTLGFISRPVTMNAFLTQRLIPRNASRGRHESFFFWIFVTMTYLLLFGYLHLIPYTHSQSIRWSFLFSLSFSSLGHSCSYRSQHTINLSGTMASPVLCFSLYYQSLPQQPGLSCLQYLQTSGSSQFCFSSDTHGLS